MLGTGDVLGDLLKIAVTVKKAAEPVKGNLSVGSTGIDHSGANFADREYTVLSINSIDRQGFYPTSKPQDGDRIIVQYLDNGEKKTYGLKTKQEQHNSIMAGRAAQTKKIPGFLSVDKIDWTAEMAYFLGWLAGAGSVHFYVETYESNADHIIDQYHVMTGVIMSAKKGIFNIAPEGSKYGSKCEITFKPTDKMPDSLASQQDQRAGLISRYGLFWALIEHGFLWEGPQQPAKVRAFIPQSVQADFDRGLAGQ